MKRICVFQSVSTALRVSEKKKKGDEKKSNITGDDE